MAITTQFLTGFEHGFVGSTATAGGGLYTTHQATGGVTTATTTGPRNGSYCLHCVQATGTSAVGATYTMTGSPAKAVQRFAIKVSSRPSSGNSIIAAMSNVANVANLYITSTGLLVMGTPSGTHVDGPIIDTVNYHLIEIQANSNGTNMVVDWKVDGVAQGQYTIASTGTAWGNITLGTSVAASQVAFTADYDDWIIGTWITAATDWYGDGKVIAQRAGVDGTHATVTSLSPGDAGTAYSGTVTTANTMVDDAPATGGWTATRSTTDNLALRTATVGAYLEIKPATTAESATANAVRAIMSYSSSTATANLAACDVRNSAGTVTALRGLTGGVGAGFNVTANNFGGGIVTVPAAGWTAAEVNAVRFRFGGCTSADISPVPTVQAMMLEVDWPIAAPAKVDTLTENFNAALDTVTKWDTTAGVSLSSNRLLITPTTGYPSLTSHVSYDLVASSAFCQLVQALNIGSGSTDTIFGVQVDVNNEATFDINNGVLIMHSKTATVNNDDTSITYNATTHAWLRIRESGGNLLWDTSTDGLTWTNRRSIAAPAWVSASRVFVLFVAGYGAEASPGTALYDNLNIAPTVVPMKSIVKRQAITRAAVH